MLSDALNTARHRTSSAAGVVVGALVLLVMLAGCRGKPESISEREETCRAMCSLIACYGPTSPELSDECTDRCFEDWSEAEAFSDACGEAYGEGTECIGALTCVQYQAWEYGEESICDDAVSMFESECPSRGP